ncbi:MAG TPA: hypothetical protein VMV44_04985 [Rectinemataceae bacterium]|nr:hypothetical protein [Rectinemataceae bacterium]
MKRLVIALVTILALVTLFRETEPPADSAQRMVAAGMELVP